MRQLTIILSLLFVSMYSIRFSNAQEQNEPDSSMKFGAQIRMRTEFDNRDFRSSTDMNSYTFLRTRLSAAATPVKNYSLFVQIQDSRVIGKEASPSDNLKNVDLFQAYIQLHAFLWDKHHLKIGRMEVVYDQERLIGRANWNNTGRSFNGLLSTFEFGTNFQLDLFGFQTEEKSQPPAPADSFSLARSSTDRDDRWFKGMYFMYTPADISRISTYVLWDDDATRKNITGAQNNDSLSRWTFGLYGQHKMSDFTINAEAAYQTGQVTGKKIRAYLASLKLHYLFSAASWKPEFMTGIDLLSGDNNKNDRYEKTFNTLYASNHKFYGYMDYFTDISRQTKNLGLRALYSGIKIKPGKSSAIELTYYHFTSPTKNADINSKFFGQELDLAFQYRFNRNFQWEQGASLFLPARLMKQFFGGKSKGYWLYGSAHFTI